MAMLGIKSLVRTAFPAEGALPFFSFMGETVAPSATNRSDRGRNFYLHASVGMQMIRPHLTCLVSGSDLYSHTKC